MKRAEKEKIILNHLRSLMIKRPGKCSKPITRRASNEFLKSILDGPYYSRLVKSKAWFNELRPYFGGSYAIVIAYHVDSSTNTDGSGGDTYDAIIQSENNKYFKVRFEEERESRNNFGIWVGKTEEMTEKQVVKHILEREEVVFEQGLYFFERMQTG